MNILQRVVLVSLLCSGVAFADVRMPGGSAGEVTLNWQKFDEIWTKLQQMEKTIEEYQKPEHKPPVPYTITKAAYKGDVLSSKIAMTAAFELDVYESKEWVKIPFLPSNTAITEARLDGEPVGVVQEGGFHQLVMKKPGRHVLRVAFSVKAPKAEEAPQFNFNVQETPMTLIALDMPQPKLEVNIEPSQGVETTTLENGNTRVTAALSPTSNISVRWQKATAEEIAGPAKLYLDNQQLVTVSEGTLKSYWALNYSILHKGTREIRLRVPEDWNILAATCEGLQEWKIVQGTKGSELLIQLAYARRGSLSVFVNAEKGMGEKDEVIEIPRLTPINVEREQGTVGVEAKGAVELQVQNASGLQAIDPKELPSGLWQAATQPILFAFRYTKPYSLALSVTRHPEVAVLTTTIDDANGITVLTPRGQLITRVRYQVRNQLKQYLAIRLPKESELWSAFVAGEPVKPTKAEDGTFRIPLAKSQLGNQGQVGFPVEIIYFRSVPKFLPAGYRTMALPMPDAPVSRMLWSLYLPEKYRFPYFGGDVEKGEMAQPWRAIGGSLMSLSEMEEDARKPAAAPALRSEASRLKRDLNSLAKSLVGEKNKMGYVGALDEMTSRQAELAADLFQQKDQPMAAGIFPVAFNLPASGQLFNFGQIMIVGQDPVVSLIYVHARIIQLMGLLLLALAGAGLYKTRGVLLRLVQESVSRLRAWVPAKA